MNKRFVTVYLRSLVFLLCVSAVNLFPQDFKTVRDGVEYAELTRTIGGQPIRMNLLRLDLTKVRLDVVHAMDMAIGTETVSSMAERHGAFAAINGGFFRLDNSIWGGDAAGVLYVNRRLLSESHNNRTSLFISNRPDLTTVTFAPITVNETFTISKKSTGFSGVNRERKDNEVIEYTPEFGQSTLTNNEGVEVIVRDGKITSVVDEQGSATIPCDGVVISATGAMRTQLLSVAKVGIRVKFGTVVSHRIGNSFPNEESSRTDFAFSGAEDITNGVPQLIRNGKIDITWQEEKASKSFVETRHPRTAVAKLKNGTFLMITVDGRSESSGGISLYDLAALLLELGATDAMNLDGGGSTTMFLNGKVVNHPSDKEGERKVSDAILVTLRIPGPARKTKK
jgi:hypothetical protein